MDRAFARASVSANGFGSRVGRAMSLASTAVAAGSGAMALGIGYVVKQAADFQSEMNTFQVVSQASGKQMTQASALAKKLGADMTLPATSAADAAKAMTELSKAGLKTKDVFSAAKGVLQLSAAAEVDNATAAQIAANNLNAFHLAGNQASHVADLLAAASIAASGSMTDMAESLQYTAATAAQAHVPIEDTVAAIGEMANKGMIGSQSGAALQQMLLKLESPSKKGAAAIKGLGISVYDAHGAMKPLPALIDEFSKATHGMSDSQRNAAMNAIFGSRAIRAANVVLLGGKDAFDKMRVAVDRQGAAAAVARAKMKGFHGAMQGLQSQVETLAISLGTPLLAPLTTAANKLSTFIGNFGSAKGFTAKVNVVVDFGEDIGKKLDEALFGAASTTIAGRNTSGAGAGRLSGGLTQMIQNAVHGVTWTEVGKSIGDGFSGAVDKSLSSTSGLPSKFEAAFRSIDWQKMGRAMGPGIATAILSAFVAVTSPMFWIKNWDLMLAIAIAVFPAGKFFKIGALLERVFGPMILRLALVLERLSPRLAEAFLSGMLRLPGLASGVLSRVGGVVGRGFRKLGSLARFTIKVLGIQAAIDAAVGVARDIWNALKKLPGLMVEIGKEIPAGLANGIKAAAGGVLSAAENLARSVKDKFVGILKIHSPSLVMMEIGEMVGAGLALGILKGQIGVQKATVAVANAATRAALAEVNKLQAQMDAAARAKENRDEAQAIIDAQKAVAAARKKGKGVADAEKQLADALQARQDTLRQRELDKAQKHYDQLQAAAQKANDKLLALQQKAADKLARVQDLAGNAFDRMAAKIRSAFDAKNSAFVAPAQAAIDAIMGRRHGEDMQQAVDDAAKQLSDAQKAVRDAQGLSPNDGESDADFAARKSQAVADANAGLLSAQRQYERAKEDITLDGYASDAAAQTTAHDQMVAAQGEQLDDMLAALRERWTTAGTAADAGMKDILAIIGKYDGDFATIGSILGDSFVKSLQDSISGATRAAGTVGNATGIAAPSATRPDDRPGPRGAAPMELTVNMPNYLGNERDVANTIAKKIAQNSRAGFLRASDL